MSERDYNLQAGDELVFLCSAPGTLSCVWRADASSPDEPEPALRSAIEYRNYLILMLRKRVIALEREVLLLEEQIVPLFDTDGTLLKEAE